MIAVKNAKAPSSFIWKSEQLRFDRGIKSILEKGVAELQSNPSTTSKSRPEGSTGAKAPLSKLTGGLLCEEELNCRLTDTDLHIGEALYCLQVEAFQQRELEEKLPFDYTLTVVSKIRRYEALVGPKSGFLHTKVLYQSTRSISTAKAD